MSTILRIYTHGKKNKKKGRPSNWRRRRQGRRRKRYGVALKTEETAEADQKDKQAAKMLEMKEEAAASKAQETQEG